MNIHEVNRLIEAHNASARANALQARAWEEVGWGMVEDHAEATGARPAISVQVVDPDPATYPIPQPTEPRPHNQQNHVQKQSKHLQQMRSLNQPVLLFSSLCRWWSYEVCWLSCPRLVTDRVRGLITGLGFDKLSEVPETQYESLYNQAKALKEEVFDEPPF